MRKTRIKLLVLICLVMCGISVRASVDSLKAALPLVKADTDRIAILSEISFEYANNNPDSALKYLALQKAIADQLDLPRYNANVLNDLAFILYYKSDYANALINNKKALAIRQQIGDKALIISSLNKIAVIYQELADYDDATAYQLQVLKLAEELKNEQYIGITLFNIASLYVKVKNYDEALRAVKRSLAIAESRHDTFQIAQSYSARASIYDYTSQPDSAIYYYNKAMIYYKQLGALSQLGAIYNDLGVLYRGMKQDELGVKYYKLALDLATQMQSENDIIFYEVNIGSMYMDNHKPDSGFLFMQRALAHKEAVKPSVLRTAYHGLERYYILKDEHDSAMRYNSLYRDISDTMYSRALSGQMNELLTKYDVEKKEQQIVLLNAQNTTKQLSIDRRNVLIGAIAIVFVMALILAVLFYNRYKLKQEAILQEEILRQQQRASNEVIAAEELERQRIARDLHDGIGQMFSAVKMNLSGIAHRVQIADEGDRALLDKTLKLVDESCREVREISHQMMPNVLLKMGLAMAIRDFIDKIDGSRLKVTLETFGLKEPLETNVETVLYRVVQESVNNAIKHANATTLDIQLHKDDDSITVTIEDNGTGFDRSMNTEGIGLKSMRARVAFLNGKVDHDSAPGRGTLVAIYIPYKSA